MSLGIGLGIHYSRTRPPIQLEAPTNQSATMQSGPSLQATWTDPPLAPLGIDVTLYNVTADTNVEAVNVSPGFGIYNFGATLNFGETYRARLQTKGNGSSYLESATVETNDITI